MTGSRKIDESKTFGLTTDSTPIVTPSFDALRGAGRERHTLRTAAIFDKDGTETITLSDVVLSLQQFL